MHDFCCSNILICYDPKYVEQRSDSSKFDKKSDMYISKWKKREFLVTDKHCNDGAKQKNWKFSKEDNLNCKVKMNKPNNGLSSVTSKTQTYIPDTSVEKLLNCFNYEIDPRADFHNVSNVHKGSSTVVQKSSKFLKRSQIFPCFSSIVQNQKKSCRDNLKKLSVNAYREPFCARCEKRRIKSISKKRYKYSKRSPYYTDEDIKRPDSYVLAEKHGHPVYYNPKLLKNPFSKSSTTSYTSCDSEYENISRYCYKKRMQNYFLKEHERNKEIKRKYFGNKKQPCFSKIERLLPYQVIATPFWEEDRSFDSNSTRCSALPSTSSGFWEYLTDKITRKTKDTERTKSCKCGQSASFISSINDAECLKVVEKISETEKKVNAILAAPGEITDGLTKEISRAKNCTCDCKKNKGDSAASKDVQTCSRINTPCNKCNNDKNKNETRSKGGDDSKSNKVEEPCRAPHDEVVSKLKQKYNGEILCIHNPPCILINGCLNLPATNVAPKPTLACWPVNQVKKNNSHNFYKRIWSQKDKAGEQLDFYGFPYVSSSECQIPTLAKKDRNNHFNQKPICELVKLSCKPKYGVTAINPRVHVAMLRKQPKCIAAQNADKKQKSKYSQAAKSQKKIILHRAKNKVTGFLQSKTEVLYPVDHAAPSPGSVPVYHKNRLLRMIQVKRSATK